jgi:hypothetical protein
VVVVVCIKLAPSRSGGASHARAMFCGLADAGVRLSRSSASTRKPRQPVVQLTAENLAVEAENGITYATRRCGNVAESRPPVVFL